MNTRVKVPRTTLIERIQKAIADGEAEAAAAMEEYRKKVKKLGPSIRAEVSDFSHKVATITDDELVEFVIELTGRYSSLSFHSDIKLPSKPYPYNPEYDKRMLRILEASTDDTISVSTRDGLYQYL